MLIAVNLYGFIPENPIRYTFYNLWEPNTIFSSLEFSSYVVYGVFC